MPLDAATAADPAQDGRQRLRGAFLIDLARIRPDPAQPRRAFDEAELSNLTASVREQGIRQPIRVWYQASENTYRIIAGERRYRAATAAGLPSVPCLVEPTPAGAAAPPRTEILVEQISENWQRADLKPLELSDALAELRDALQIGPRELAKRLSKPESEVSRLLSLQKIDPQLRKAVTEPGPSTFTRRHLIAVAQVPAAEQAAVIMQVRERNLTALETERHVASLKGETAGKSSEQRRGSVRRFVIGAATVEVRFRKRDATDEEVLDALERACRLLREKEAGAGAS